MADKPSSPPTSPLARLPSVDRLLSAEPTQAIVAEFGRAETTGAIRDVLADLRRELSASGGAPPEAEVILSAVADRLARQAAPSLKAVFNLTGTVLHTNLGRAALPEEAIAAVADAARGASNLEYRIGEGKRGDRDEHIEDQLCAMTGAEAATIVNNNAAAVMLVLNTFALGKEVPTSRGELIEIGGSFRLPEIFELSGVILREVGTTNRTSLKDYEKAIGPDTAAIMHVHPSNYRVVGFASKPDEADMFTLARQHGIIAIDDIGSGAMFDTREAGLPYEPTFQHSIDAGADVVLGSGDKLLGGPQCGIIVGTNECVAKIRNHPLARAVRVGKLTLAALGATLDSYVRDEARSEIPTQAMLFATTEELQTRAEAIKEEIADVPGLQLSIRDDVAQVGGGSLPAVELPTVVIAMKHQKLSADDLAVRLRTGRIGVFARIHNDEVLLDIRSVLPEDDSRLALAVRLIRPEH